MKAARRIAAVFAAVMLLATAAFAIGVSIEKNKGSGETTSGVHPSGESDGDTGEGQAQGEGGTPGDTGSHSEGTETVAGVKVESTPLIVRAVVASLAVAGAALVWPRRELFALAAVFCVAFAILDGRDTPWAQAPTGPLPLASD